MGGSGGTESISVEKEMGISHQEFFRVMTRALEGRDYAIDGNRLSIQDKDRRMEMILADQSERRLGMVVLPVTRIRIELSGYGAEDAALAIAWFDRRFQRGGG